MALQERRKAPRFTLTLNGFLLDVKGRSTQFPAACKNLSSTGANVITRNHFQAKDRIRLLLEWPSDSKASPAWLMTSGKVLEVEETLSDESSLRVQFTDAISLVGKNGVEDGVPAQPDPGNPPLIFEFNLIDEKIFQYYGALRRTKQYVEENYQSEISLEKAARVAAMERTYFSSFFKAKLGVGFAAWLRQLRISKAIELMQTEDRSITEIAYEVGFGDLRTFERAFRQCTNTAPRDFRRLVTPRIEQ